jgi:hypothetical protein
MILNTYIYMKSGNSLAPQMQLLCQIHRDTSSNPLPVITFVVLKHISASDPELPPLPTEILFNKVTQELIWQTKDKLPNSSFTDRYQIEVFRYAMKLGSVDPVRQSSTKIYIQTGKLHSP